MWRSFHHLIRVVDLIIGEAAAVPGDNKQKNMGAERKSRRALGDIGNMVTDSQFVVSMANRFLRILDLLRGTERLLSVVHNVLNIEFSNV